MLHFYGPGFGPTYNRVYQTVLTAWKISLGLFVYGLKGYHQSDDLMVFWTLVHGLHVRVLRHPDASKTKTYSDQSSFPKEEKK